MNKTIEFEYRTQAHLMSVEGSCDEKPTEQEIIFHAINRGYAVSNIEIWWDLCRHWWAFVADIKPLPEETTNE